MALTLPSQAADPQRITYDVDPDQDLLSTKTIRGSVTMTIPTLLVLAFVLASAAEKALTPEALGKILDDDAKALR